MVPRDLIHRSDRLTVVRWRGRLQPRPRIAAVCRAMGSSCRQWRTLTTPSTTTWPNGSALIPGNPNKRCVELKRGARHPLSNPPRSGDPGSERPRDDPGEVRPRPRSASPAIVGSELRTLGPRNLRSCLSFGWTVRRQLKRLSLRSPSTPSIPETRSQKGESVHAARETVVHRS